jgi:hypothetical protein
MSYAYSWQLINEYAVEMSVVECAGRFVRGSVQFCNVRVKDKAIAVQVCSGPAGSWRLGLPEFLHSQHVKVTMLSASLTGRLYPQRDAPSAHFC